MRSLTLADRAEIRVDAIFDVFGQRAVDLWGTRELAYKDVLGVMVKQAEDDANANAIADDLDSPPSIPDDYEQTAREMIAEATS